MLSGSADGGRGVIVRNSDRTSAIRSAVEAPNKGRVRLVALQRKQVKLRLTKTSRGKKALGKIGIELV